MICQPCKDAADANPGVPHTPCKIDCGCQHGKPWECAPDSMPEGYAGYLDALPDDHPRRRAYEEATGRALPPRGSTVQRCSRKEPHAEHLPCLGVQAVDLGEMAGHCCFAGCTLTTCSKCGASYCVNGGMHHCPVQRDALGRPPQPQGGAEAMP